MVGCLVGCCFGCFGYYFVVEFDAAMICLIVLLWFTSLVILCKFADCYGCLFCLVDCGFVADVGVVYLVICLFSVLRA